MTFKKLQHNSSCFVCVVYGLYTFVSSYLCFVNIECNDFYLYETIIGVHAHKYSVITNPYLTKNAFFMLHTTYWVFLSCLFTHKIDIIIFKSILWFSTKSAVGVVFVCVLYCVVHCMCVSLQFMLIIVKARGYIIQCTVLFNLLQ